MSVVEVNCKNCYLKPSTRPLIALFTLTGYVLSRILPFIYCSTYIPITLLEVFVFKGKNRRQC